MTTPALNPTLQSGSPLAIRSRPGPLIIFFLLAYAGMWACFISVAATGTPPDRPVGAVLIILGAFAPAFAALWVTWREEGEGGVSALLKRVIQWRVAGYWYFFAAGYVVVVKLIVALIHRVVLGTWPRFGNLPWYLLVAAMLFSMPFQAGEEIGWRGYALPRLTARFGLARASLLLGVIWAVWHIPQFFIRGADSYRQSFLVFGLGTIAVSVALAWLFARTHGSLLLPMLMHAAFNNLKDILPSASPASPGIFSLTASPIAWMTVGVLWVFAVFFLLTMPKIQLGS
jgi:membrane protease YdiL (CAAX protease family)